MLTVWTGWWGDKYAEEYVHRLGRALDRRLPVPHRRRLLADAKVEGWEYEPIRRPWASWWHKLELFERDEPGTLNLWLDLDSVLLADPSHLLLEHAGDRIAMPKNWAQSGHDSCQSSLIIWQGGACRDLLDGFDYEATRTRLWGDQEWITERYGKPGEGIVTPVRHPAVVSYKYHCQAGPPAGAVVATFHGEPKPHEVSDAWLTANWS